MLSVAECKIYVPSLDLSDKAIEKFRNSLYLMIEEVLDELYERETNN